MNDKSESYFVVYGGFKALFKSKYLYWAAAINCICFNIWMSTTWWNDVITILPGMLGFSLGGYAMFVSVGSEDFRNALSRVKDRGHSIFMNVNAMFMHFIVVQLIGIVYALLNKALYFQATKYPLLSVLDPFQFSFFKYLVLVNNFFGYWLFIYALLTALAATNGIFKISRLSNKTLEIDDWTSEYKHLRSVNSDFEPNLATFFQSVKRGDVDGSKLSFGISLRLYDPSTKHLNEKGEYFKSLLLNENQE